MNSISSADIATFIRVIERGGFAAAAEDTGLTPSGVSRSVSRLEDRLGVRLIERTTRQLRLTPEGETMLGRGRDILASIEAAESEVTSARGKPRGLIRVNTGTAYAKHHLLGALPRFRAAYPDITIDLSINDRRVDIIAEQIDVAIRTGPLSDSSLVARKIGEAKRVIVASPDYIRRKGRPEMPADLVHHDCLVVSGLSRLAEWPLRIDGRVVPYATKPVIICDSADLLLDMAIAGLGLVRLMSTLSRKAIAEGRLVEVLAEHHVSETIPIHAVMPSGRQGLPRVRAFVDFIATDSETRVNPEN